MARRVRNDIVDDGRYSACVDADAESVEGDDWRPNLNGNALRVLVAVRERISAKCGAVLDRDSNLLGSGFLEEGLSSRNRELRLKRTVWYLSEFHTLPTLNKGIDRS